jgi:hypothetical protein
MKTTLAVVAAVIAMTLGANFASADNHHKDKHHHKHCTMIHGHKHCK